MALVLRDRLEFKFFNSSVDEVPFLNIQQKKLDENQLVDCRYGNSFFEHWRLDEYDLDFEKIIVLRGYHSTSVLCEFRQNQIFHSPWFKATKNKC